MLPIKFQVNWPFGSGEAKNRFQDGGNDGHLGFLIGTILATFELQVIPILLPSFESNGLSVQEKKLEKSSKMAAILVLAYFLFHIFINTSIHLHRHYMSMLNI